MAQIRALNSDGKVDIYDAELTVSVLNLQGAYSTESLAEFLKRLENLTGRNYVCASSPTNLAHCIFDVSGDGYPLGVFGETVRRVVSDFPVNGGKLDAEVLITSAA